MSNQNPDNVNAMWSASLIGLAILSVLVGFGMWGCPNYNAWRAGVAGQGELARAEQNRRIKVLEARAMFDSADMYAKAEVRRAEGIRDANAIIAEGLKGHDEYLRYLWIDKVAGNAQREIIYVPTEANLPILEAGKRGVDRVELSASTSKSIEP